MKQRILYLDLLRIIACVMIVMMHSQRAGMGMPYMILCTLFTLLVVWFLTWAMGKEPGGKWGSGGCLQITCL